MSVNDEDEDISKVDFSVIAMAIEAGGTMLQQILKNIQYGTGETRRLLFNESDFILECKVCRNLFRSFPLFVAHKRIYCTAEFQNVNPGRFDLDVAPPTEDIVVVEPRPTTPENHVDSVLGSNKSNCVKETKSKKSPPSPSKGQKDTDDTNKAKVTVQCKDNTKTSTTKDKTAENKSIQNITTRLTHNKSGAPISRNDTVAKDMENVLQSKTVSKTSQKSSSISASTERSEKVAQNTTVTSTNKAAPESVKGRPRSSMRNIVSNSQKSVESQEDMNTEGKSTLELLLTGQFKGKSSAYCSLTNTARKVEAAKTTQKSSTITLTPIASNANAMFMNVSKKATSDNTLEVSVDMEVDSPTSSSDKKKEIEQNTELKNTNEKCIVPDIQVVTTVKPQPGKQDVELRPVRSQSTLADEVMELELVGHCDLKTSTCKICKLSYTGQKGLIQHMRVKHSGNTWRFPCCFCTKQFRFFWSLTRHLDTTHRKTKVQIDKLRKKLRDLAYQVKDSNDSPTTDSSESPPTPESKSVAKKTSLLPTNVQTSKGLKLVKPEQLVKLYKCRGCVKAFWKKTSYDEHTQQCKFVTPQSSPEVMVSLRSEFVHGSNPSQKESMPPKQNSAGIKSRTTSENSSSSVESNNRNSSSIDKKANISNNSATRKSRRSVRVPGRFTNRSPSTDRESNQSSSEMTQRKTKSVTKDISPSPKKADTDFTKQSTSKENSPQKLPPPEPVVTRKSAAEIKQAEVEAKQMRTRFFDKRRESNFDKTPPKIPPSPKKNKPDTPESDSELDRATRIEKMIKEKLSEARGSKVAKPQESSPNIGSSPKLTLLPQIMTNTRRSLPTSRDTSRDSRSSRDTSRDSSNERSSLQLRSRSGSLTGDKRKSLSDRDTETKNVKTDNKAEVKRTNSPSITHNRRSLKTENQSENTHDTNEPKSVPKTEIKSPLIATRTRNRCSSVHEETPESRQVSSTSEVKNQSKLKKTSHNSKGGKGKILTHAKSDKKRSNSDEVDGEDDDNDNGSKMKVLDDLKNKLLGLTKEYKPAFSNKIVDVSKPVSTNDYLGLKMAMSSSSHTSVKDDTDVKKNTVTHDKDIDDRDSTQKKHPASISGRIISPEEVLEDQGRTVEVIWCNKQPGEPMTEVAAIMGEETKSLNKPIKVLPSRMYVVDQQPRNKVTANKLKLLDKTKIGDFIDVDTFKCNQCDIQFSSMSNVRRHVVRHLGWQRYKCKLCKFSSYNKSECNSHLYRKHPNKIRGQSAAQFITDLKKEGSKIRNQKKQETMKLRQSSSQEGHNLRSRTMTVKSPLSKRTTQKSAVYQPKSGAVPQKTRSKSQQNASSETQQEKRKSLSDLKTDTKHADYDLKISNVDVSESNANRATRKRKRSNSEEGKPQRNAENTQTDSKENVQTPIIRRSQSLDGTKNSLDMCNEALSDTCDIPSVSDYDENSDNEGQSSPPSGSKMAPNLNTMMAALEEAKAFVFVRGVRKGRRNSLPPKKLQRLSTDQSSVDSDKIGCEEDSSSVGKVNSMEVAEDGVVPMIDSVEDNNSENAPPSNKPLSTKLTSVNQESIDTSDSKVNTMKTRRSESPSLGATESYTPVSESAEKSTVVEPRSLRLRTKKDSETPDAKDKSNDTV